MKWELLWSNIELILLFSSCFPSVELSCSYFYWCFFPHTFWKSSSYICLGVFLDETWGIKWSLIESTMILIALIRSCPCFSLASSSSSYAISSLMYFSRPFSFKMRLILYFQSRKFSRPSNLSSSLVLASILSNRSLKNEISQNRRLNLPIDALDWGELVGPTNF